jgi:hypothetical protein
LERALRRATQAHQDLSQATSELADRLGPSPADPTLSLAEAMTPPPPPAPPDLPVAPSIPAALASSAPPSIPVPGGPAPKVPGAPSAH